MKNTSTQAHIEQILWLRAHRGILSLIARKTGYTPQFVRLVYWGERRSKNGSVERMLRKHEASMPQTRRRVNV